MEESFSFYFTIYCVVHLWTAAIMLFLLPKNRTSNRLFAVFLLLFSNVHLNHLALQSGLTFKFPWMYYDPLCGVFLCALAPVFFFYVQSMTGGWHWNFKEHGIHLLAVVPACLHLLFLIIAKSPYELKSYYYQEASQFTLVNALLLMGMIALLTFYLYQSLKRIREYDRLLKEQFSDIEKIRMNWLWQLVLLLLVLTVVLSSVLVVIGHPEWNRIGMGMYTSIVFVLMMYKSIYYEQPSQMEEVIMIKSSPEVLDKYQKSTLSSEQEEIYLNRIVAYLKEQKPYLKPDFSLSDFSSAVDIPLHQLSQVINRSMQVNFFDLINSYRVEEVKTRLCDSAFQYLSIEGIALDSGFGSKASFYKAFKKHTGQTPTEFKQQLAVA